MADRYWVGGTDTWNGTAGTKWATTSGGAGGAAVPTTSDDVFFDAASGAVTITQSSTRTCRNFDCTGFTGTFAGSGALTCAATTTFKLVAGMTYSRTGDVTFTGTSGTCVITTAGKTLNHAVSSNGVGGTRQLADDLTLSAGSSSTFTVSGGTFDQNNFDVRCNIASTSASATRAWHFGTGQVIIINASVGTTVFNALDQSGLTVTYAAGAAIRLTGANSSVRTIEMDTSPVVDWPPISIEAGSGNISPRNVRCESWTHTSGHTGSLSSGLGSLTLHGGGFVFNAANGTPVADTDAIVFAATSGTHVIDLAGKTLDRPLTFDGAGGTFQYADHVTLGSTRAITLTNGTLDTNGYDTSAGSLAAANGTTIDLASGTHTFASATDAWSAGSTTTVTPGTSTIVLTDANADFLGGGHAYHDLEFATAGGTCAINGDNTFHRLSTPSPGAAMTLQFASGTFTYVDEFDVNGAVGALVTLRASTTASFSLIAEGDPIACEYVDVQWSAATGGWAAGIGSVNSGNNTGWTFLGTRRGGFSPTMLAFFARRRRDR